MNRKINKMELITTQFIKTLSTYLLNFSLIRLFRNQMHTLWWAKWSNSIVLVHSSHSKMILLTV